MDLLSCAIAEHHLSALEPRHVGLNRQLAAGEVVQDPRVHDRMRLEHLVVGRLETEARNIAVDEAQEPGEHDLRKPEWHTPVAMGESVERLAEDILGHY